MTHTGADKETLPLTRFAIPYKYKQGFIRGTREAPQWSSPETCACCGGPAVETFEEHLECEVGSKKYSMDIHVPYCPTCAAHVGARAADAARARRTAIAVAVLAAAGAVVVVWQLGGGGDFFEVFKQWHAGAVAVAAFAVYGAVNWVLVRRYRERPGATLPSTPNCTMKLGAALVNTTARIFSEDDLAVHLTCACPSFADEFRKQNAEFIAEETRLRGSTIRTPRGDRMLTKTEELT